jgi:hypothetical protein
MAEAYHTVYYELRDALAGPGCPICALALRSLLRTFAALAYESVNDRGVRDQVRAAHGFCAIHGEMLTEARSALGTAIIHRDLVHAMNERLRELAPNERGFLAGIFSRGGRAEPDPLLPRRACVACTRRRESEQIYLQTLLQHMRADSLLPSFRDSAGLCLPHLRAALRQTTDANSFTQLQAAQCAIWERLTAELDEFIRKQDHQFTDEPVGAERDSWSRAVLLISSHPQLGREHDE